MERALALSVVAAVIIFAAVYALTIWNHGAGQSTVWDTIRDT